MRLSAVWFVVSPVSAGKQQRSDLSIMPAVTYRVELGFPPLEVSSLMEIAASLEPHTGL
jgi:hypothetical protein